MKILLAMHDKSVLQFYRMLSDFKGHESITPINGKTFDNVIDVLSQKPDKVIMDINYGMHGVDSDSPFLRVEEAMRTRGYDTKKQLLGITALPLLAQNVREKYGLAAAIKVTDQAAISNFFAS